MVEYKVPNPAPYRFTVSERGLIQKVILSVKDAPDLVFSSCCDDTKHEVLFTDDTKKSALKCFIRHADTRETDQLLSSLKEEDKELAIKCLREFHSEILKLMVKYV